MISYPDLFANTIAEARAVFRTAMLEGLFVKKTAQFRNQVLPFAFVETLELRFMLIMSVDVLVSKIH